jgi:DNA-binding beta-propeller fold protein YncE
LRSVSQVHPAYCDHALLQCRGKQSNQTSMKPSTTGFVTITALGGIIAFSQTPLLRADQAGPYKIVNSAQVPGSGGIDYVFADSDGRRLYVPRGNQVLVFNLDTLQSVGSITNARARGVAVDPKSNHGFCSSSPVVMWDTKTLETLKSIPVEGGPDGILFEPMTERIYVFSHRAPNARPSQLRGCRPPRRHCR